MTEPNWSEERDRLQREWAVALLKDEGYRIVKWDDETADGEYVRIVEEL